MYVCVCMCVRVRVCENFAFDMFLTFFFLFQNFVIHSVFLS